jgi:aspartate aminotransferase-like enzyme
LFNHSLIPSADQISSATATRFPLTELIALCKQHNALVLVDGAHAPGQVPLNLEAMGNSGVDFFIGEQLCIRRITGLGTKVCPLGRDNQI